MGLFGLFGGSEAEKAQKLKPKVVQKYGDPATRQKAISQLGEMTAPEAVTTLLSRFTITVEPGTVDADEKDQVFQLVKGFGEKAVAPVTEFLSKVEHATSWALRILQALLPEEQVVGTATGALIQLAASYTRNPEKKLVLIQFLEGKTDPRIAPALLPFLEDMADDVKIAALKGLGKLGHEPAREPILQLLTHPDTAKRVQTAAIAALFESGFGVQGYREKVEALLQDPYFVDKSGVVKKRG